MNPAQPTIHPLSVDVEPTELVESLTRRERERERDDDGIHVVVHVTASGNTAYARVVDERSLGNGSQRWLKHARRGSSPGGWSELHHPRNEQRVGEWKAKNAGILDRLLIEHSKQAWRLDGTAPYVVEFPVIPLDGSGIEDPA